MLNSLDALVIVFFGFAVCSILGLVLQFVVKNEKVKKAAFYFSAVLPVILAFCNYESTPHYLTADIFSGFAFGVLAIGAVLFQLIRKDAESFKLARALMAAAVIGGFFCTFFI